MQISVAHNLLQVFVIVWSNWIARMAQIINICRPESVFVAYDHLAGSETPRKPDSLSHSRIVERRVGL